MPSATSLKQVQAAKQKLNKILRVLEVEHSDILAREAPKVYNEAVAMTPYRSGKLEASVYVKVSKDKKRPGLTIGASARDPRNSYNYAAIQHENEEFSHEIKGYPHYLIIPFNKGIRRIQYAVKKRLQEEAKRK